ncbi:MAG: hypothetical protein JXA54_00540 [Candidatus Heimdallarchaeota archaeon]|nr:hypothetical protein [Candidatus Heimdallarchaeota archaeon]
MSGDTATKTQQLPLLLKNLKKTFGNNLQGPLEYREKEFSASTKSIFIPDIVKFLANRGIRKLAAIYAWETEKEIKLSYHFIAKIGNDFSDSKITIITFLPLNERSIISIKKIFQNARIFEEDITKSIAIEFIEK